jgi:hypothetical protein
MDATSMSTEPGTVSETSATAPSCMKRRDAFIEEIAATIDAGRSGGMGESFVFGLSGRWGEGKTYLLAQLEGPLKHRGYGVIRLNPWKFSGDRVAFLRYFLVKLLRTQSRSERVAVAWQCCRLGKWGEAIAMLRPARTLAAIRTDVSKQRVEWPSLIGILVVVAAVYWGAVSWLRESIEASRRAGSCHSPSWPSQC